MIAKNEEKTIARCINSYKAIVHEVIVVDTGSTDNTVQIAEAYGAKVFHFEWVNDFSKAKNYALEQASGDWILFLDADEYFDAAKASNLPKIIKGLGNSYNCVACKMKNVDYVTGKELDEIVHVRIFKNDKRIRYVNAIHEMLVDQRQGKSLQAYLLTENELLIYHTGYTSLNRGEKAARNLQLLLNELDQDVVKPSVYQYISDCYYGLEDYENAIKFARLFIDTGATFIGYNVKPYQNIIDSMLRMKYNADDIMIEIERAMDKFPSHPSFHLYLANLLYDLKDFDRAYGEYKKTLKLQHDYNDMEINSVPSNIYHVYYCMGAIATYKNDKQEAISCFLKVLGLEKYHAASFKRLIMLTSNLSTAEIVQQINIIYDLNKKTDIDFILSHIVTCSGMKTVLSYYINVRYRAFQIEDYWVLYLLIIGGQHEKVFRVALECFSQDGTADVFRKQAFIAALLSKRSEYLEMVARVADASTAKLIMNMLSTHNLEKLNEADKATYFDLLELVMVFGEASDIETLIGLHTCFEANTLLEVGEFLIDNNRFDIAVKLYGDQLEHVVPGCFPSYLVFRLGYCYYKLESYDRAAECFLQLTNVGDYAQELRSLMEWTCIKISSTRLKEAIEGRLCGG